MNDDIIRYDLIVQEALLGAVRKILINAAQEGLPGDHHFLVTFKTTAPGVQLSKRMRRQYPDEMTIVLQHQFWDLTITESHFEVGLSFKNVPEKLSIPFNALTGFSDPSVQFALRFDVDALETPSEASQRQDNIEGATPPAAQIAAPRLQHDNDLLHGADLSAKNDQSADDGEASANADGKASTNASGSDSGENQDGDGKVVSIGAFRRKT